MGGSDLDHSSSLVIIDLSHVTLIGPDLAELHRNQDLARRSTRDTRQPRKLELEVVRDLIVLDN
jgi:hypothetical protein